jgi:hypothetical protein
MKNHYETIGLSPSATPEQIKAAYTNAVLQLQGQPDFAIRFGAIQEAYDILSHTETRKAFDKELLNFYTGKFTNHSKLTVLRTPPKYNPKQKVIRSNSTSKANFDYKKAFPYITYFGLVFIVIILVLCLRACNNTEPTESVPAVSQEPQKTIPQENHDLNTSEFNKNNSEDASNTNTPHTPSIDEVFHNANPSISKPVYVDHVVQDSLRLIKNGYLPHHVRNGSEPDCFNYAPQHDEINNKLIVEVGGGTDVAIKIMSRRTNKCIRYFFINSLSTFTTNGIPEGTYYLKIAYGKQWMMNNEGGNCKGKFLRNPKYEIGEETLDYNIKYYETYNDIPSYELKLDVISTGIMNSFRSDEISEEQFNK